MTKAVCRKLVKEENQIVIVLLISSAVVFSPSWYRTEKVVTLMVRMLFYALLSTCYSFDCNVAHSKFAIGGMCMMVVCTACSFILSHRGENLTVPFK